MEQPQKCRRELTGTPQDTSYNSDLVDPAEVPGFKARIL